MKLEIAIIILLSISIIVWFFSNIHDRKLKKRISKINMRLGKFPNEEVPEIGIRKIEHLLDELEKDHKFKPLEERFYVVYDGKTISVFIEEKEKIK